MKCILTDLFQNLLGYFAIPSSFRSVLELLLTLGRAEKTVLSKKENAPCRSFLGLP